MTVTDTGVDQSAPRDVARGARARPTGALLAAVGLLVVHQALRFSSLGPGGLQADLGIQYHLAELTAQGAIPHLDFQHGWNAGGFYVGAALYLLVGGNPTAWTFLFTVVTASALAGAALLVTGWRLRLPGVWLLALLVAWLWLTHVPNGKYAIPMLWLACLLPVGPLTRTVPAVTARAALAAATFWMHVELAVLLAVGVALYDLLGARDVSLRDRLLRAGILPVALAAAFGVQVALYQAAGLAPAELVRLLIGEPTAVFDEAHFGYPLFNPRGLRSLLYPVSLVLPFAPAVWRRLSAPTRLAAFLHLSQALIAIRRTDEGHVAAASTLLVVVVVLGLWDLRRAGLPTWTASGWPVRIAAVAVGGLWTAGAIAAGFRVPSLLAIVALTAVCLAGVAAARRADLPWVTTGAAVAAGALVVAGLVGHASVELASDRSGHRTQLIADAIAPSVDDCGDGTRRAWVVPEPLGLYEELGLTNPTPYYAFWYNLAAKESDIIDAMDAGDIPLIIQPYGWPQSMEGMVGAIHRRYEVCYEVLVEENGPLVRLWSHR